MGVNNTNISETIKKIPDVYVLDKNFKVLGIVDDYTSLIWSRRYYETGDFELYVHASDEYKELIQMGRYVLRSDEYTYDYTVREIFRIEKIEISTSESDGDFITASGRDLRSIIYQRCILFDWTYAQYTPMRLELIARELVYQNCIKTDIFGQAEVNSGYDPSDTLAVYNDSRRKIPNFTMGADSGLPYVVGAYEVTPQNLGEYLETICEARYWGWRVKYKGNFLSDNFELEFAIWTGKDLTQTVIFSEDFDNLLETSFVEDRSEYANSYLVVDNDNNRSFVYSLTSGLDRYERVSEADTEMGVTDSTAWQNLINTYGVSWDNTLGETGKIGWGYKRATSSFGFLWLTETRVLDGLEIYFDGYDFPLYSGNEAWENKIKTAFPNGTLVTRVGVRYWHVTDKFNCAFDSSAVQLNGWNWNVTEFPSVKDVVVDGVAKYTDKDNPNTDNDGNACNLWLPNLQITIPAIIQEAIMQTNAYANVDLYMRDTEFSGSVDYESSYRYHRDYELGDMVKIRGKYGITQDVRITEVSETFDSNGYAIEVNFKGSNT